jgi:Spy/CpxP family protein refolding chaperone
MEEMKKKKRIVVLGLAALMVLGVAYAYAQGPGFGPEHRPGQGHEKWSSLTPEQQTKFQELRRKFRDDNAKLFGAIVTKRLELQSLWTDPKAESKAILDKEKELRDLQNQIKDKAVQMRLEARTFLTPEQIQNWKAGWGMGRGFGGGHMMGRGPGMGRGGMGPGRGMGSGEGCQ